MPGSEKFTQGTLRKRIAHSGSLSKGEGTLGSCRNGKFPGWPEARGMHRAI